MKPTQTDAARTALPESDAGASQNWSEIEDVTDIELALGTTKGLPSIKDIPAEFKDQNRPTKWNKFFSHIFFNGGAGVEIEFKDGVDPRKALRWFRAHACSWDPSHEHKESGVAFRMSHWIVDWHLCPEGQQSNVTEERRK